MQDVPSHATCPHCGHKKKLSSWVYAHWDIELIGTCDGCGVEHGLKRGITYGLPRKRKKSVSRKADGSR